MSRRPRPEQEEPASWLATFGDLATLLLTFYVLIYASSTYQPGEWEAAQGALERMLGLTAGESRDVVIGGNGEGALVGNRGVIPLLVTIGATLGPEGQEAIRALEDFLGQAGSDDLYGSVEVEAGEDGFVFRLAEPVAFRAGRSTLMSDGERLLKPIARIIRGSAADVVVDGHTCDLQTRSGPFASNRELSGARAASVVRFLEAEGVGDATLAARAMGEQYPRVPNVDEKSRRKNRRVEIQVTFRQ